MCTEGVSDPTGQAMKADFEKRLFCVGKMREELKRSKVGAVVRALALVNFFRQLKKDWTIWTSTIRMTTVTHMTEVMPR